MLERFRKKFLTFDDFLEAASEGDLRTVLDYLDVNIKKINKVKPDPDNYDFKYHWSNGKTALALAAKGGHLLVVKELLMRCAKVNLPACGGVTALMLAAEGGYLDIVRELIKYGAKVNKTALKLAIKNGHSEVVHELLRSMDDLLLANSQKRPDKIEFKGDIPKHFECPITHCLMLDPTDLVISGRVFTFDRSAIITWLAIKRINPMTNLPIQGEIVLKKNTALAQEIENFVKAQEKKAKMFAARNKFFTRERLGQSGVKESEPPVLQRSLSSKAG